MPSEHCLSGFSESLDWRPVEFVDLPSALSCTLCNVVSGKTFLLPCYHAFCELCYNGLLRCNRRCPLEEEGFDEGCVQTLSFTQRQVEARMVLCVNSKYGCNFVGKMKEMSHHFRVECSFHAVACKRCSVKVIRTEIVNHYGRCFDHRRQSSSGNTSRGDLEACEAKPYALVKKDENKTEQQLKEVQELLSRLLEKQERLEAIVSNAGNEFHERVKEETRIAGEDVKRTLEVPLADLNRNLLAMKDDARISKESIATNVEEVSQRLERVSHSVSNVSENLHKVINAQEGLKSEMKKSEGEVKTVFGKQESVVADVNKGLKVLLQRLEEVSKFIGGNDNDDEVKPVAKAIFDTRNKMKSVEETLKVLLRLPDADEVFCHIRGFAEFQKEGREKYTERNSDIFLFCGYSVKLNSTIVKRDGDVYFGLYLSICQSPRDSLLKWPFSIPYTLMLVHPMDKEKNIKFNVTSFFSFLNCVRRPATSNTGLGTAKLCKLKDLEASNFVSEDSLCVGVKVSPVK